MNWINQNALAVQAIATVVLVLVSGWYAWMTHRLATAVTLEREARQRAELLGRQHRLLELSAHADRLHRDVVTALDQKSPETMSRMQREPWRSDRDHLELAGIGIGGDVGEYAMMAGQALRAWSQLMSQRDRAVDPDQAAVLWQEAMARLQAARFALEQLLDGRPQPVPGT